MPWLTLTDKELPFAPAERRAMDQIAPNTMSTIMQREIAAARGQIESGGNLLGPRGTIPGQLAGHITAIIVWRILLEFPSLPNLQTEGRKSAYADAQKIMDRVMSRNPDDRIAVELPDPGTGETSRQSPVNNITAARGRRLRSDAFDHLGSS